MINTLSLRLFSDPLIFSPLWNQLSWVQGTFHFCPIFPYFATTKSKLHSSRISITLRLAKRLSLLASIQSREEFPLPSHLVLCAMKQSLKHIRAWSDKRSEIPPETRVAAAPRQSTSLPGHSPQTVYKLLPALGLTRQAGVCSHCEHTSGSLSHIFSPSALLRLSKLGFRNVPPDNSSSSPPRSYLFHLNKHAPSLLHCEQSLCEKS